MPVFQPPELLQTAFVEITSDTTTTSGSYVDLLSLTITTDGGSMAEVHFTASVSNTALFGSSQQFQLVIDGSAVRGSHTRVLESVEASCAAITYRTGVLTAGSHTFKIQWLTDVFIFTARIRPVTTINEHASLLVSEITV